MKRKLYNGRCLMLFLGLVLVAGTVAGAAAQGEPYLELMRKDLQTEKVAVMTEAMQLSEQQGAVFWPIYREFQTKQSGIGDRRIAMIKDYAENYTDISAETAKEMTTEWFKIQEDRLSLLKKTAKKIGKDIDPVVAMRFVQVENAVNLAIDLQVASEIPLLQ